MENESPQSTKPRFSEVCQMHHLDYQAMQAIADKAGVPKQVVKEFHRCEGDAYHE